MIMCKNKYLGVLFVMICLPILVQAAPAGNIIFASGEVQIIGTDGKSRNAVKSAVVNEGDTLVTGKNGVMQIRMSDAGFIAVRPDTRLTVQSFIWNGKEDGSERSVLSLVRGGFRTITGVIGRRSKENYQVITPTATMGIRGTDHEPHYIAAPAPGETPLGEPGAYNKVNVGATFIRNPAGIVELGPNEVGFASATPGRPPVRLSTLPGFMRNAPAPLGLPDRRGEVDDDSTSRRQIFREKLADWVDGDEDRKQVARALLRFAVTVAGSGVDLSNLVSGLSVAPPGTAVVGGYTAPDVLETSGLLVTPGNNTLILLGPNNRPFFISDPGAEGLRYSRDTAPLVDSGEAGVNGTAVNWGIYAGGSVFNAGGAARTPQYFYFMGTGNVTSQSDLALAGTATYNTVVGFTKPINEAGQLGGGVTSLSVGVTFGATPRITSYDLGVQDAGGRTWVARLNSPSMLLTNFANGGNVPNLNVNCTGAGCTAGTTAGKAAGYVIGGANRDGLISSYGLKSGTASVAGAVAVK